LAPAISFRADESIARAARIESLLAQIKDAQPSSEPSSSEASPGTDGDAKV
jgi:hypothetical protein